MISIQYAKPSADLSGVTARLEELSLAHSLDQVNDQQVLALVDGDHSYQGAKAIHEYLDQLASELNQWYYCDC